MMSIALSYALAVLSHLGVADARAHQFVLGIPGTARALGAGLVLCGALMKLLIAHPE